MICRDARGFGLAILMGACATMPPHLSEAPAGALREAGLRGADDPTVRGARLFPEALDEAHGWGMEPGGGVRAIVGGVRIVSMQDGSMLVAEDRLPATPSSVVALPERLSGGFLFASGTHVWRADTWLGPAKALFTSSAPVAQLLLGLDRVYLRSPQGVLLALDPRTGTVVGLGPLPASPNIGRLAAWDAWRGVAVADLRGVLLTVDAGTTWRPLALPIEPSEVVVLGESIAVGGLDDGRQVQWWEVRSDGQTGKLASGFDRAAAKAAEAPFAPGQSVPLSRGSLGDTGQSMEAPARIFGSRPLASAIEDGWPLVDGTALVARDGALGRVRLSDGALVESVADAFALKPARCHPLALTPGEVGFSCGEPRGRTVVYRWDPPTARLVELKRFDNPRELLGFGNGALAARGPCAADGTGDAPEGEPGEQAWCLMAPAAHWREVHVPSTGRIVVRADGRTAWVRPPRAGDLSTARLTVIDGAHSEELPLLLPPVPADLARALRLGVWMDGFEERRPGVLGGWVDAAGAIVGIEIAASGELRVGEYIRDAGGPVASGRWAFGWTASRRGFETTDGGMTWTKEISMPDPIASGRAVRTRACGPVGCIAAGWLRVGWGSAGERASPSEPPPRLSVPVNAPPNLELDCEAVAGPVPPTGTRARTPSRPASAASGAREALVGWGPYAGSTWAAVSELPSFAGLAGPGMRADDLGVSAEATNGLERALRAVPLARVYVWGPKTGEWDQLGRWQVRWQWPWGGPLDVRSSAATAAPWTSLDGARRTFGMTSGAATILAVAEGDDPDHALLLARHPTSAPTVDVFLLETDRPPIEARRPSGDPFPDIEGATRIGGRWYIATVQSPGELAATVVWSIEGAIAREVVRVPRAGFEARPALRLARHTDGRALGLVVDGQPDELRGPQRWVAGIDIESSSVATPEPLALSGLSDKTVSLCSGDDAPGPSRPSSGWVLDLPYPGTVKVRIGRWESSLDAPIARMRVSHERACVERMLGSIGGYASAAPDALARAAAPHGGGGGPERLPGRHAAEGVREIDASVFAARTRYGLRCH
jgi:hypothetical protein